MFLLRRENGRRPKTTWAAPTGSAGCPAKACMPRATLDHSVSRKSPRPCDTGQMWQAGARDWGLGPLVRSLYSVLLRCWLAVGLVSLGSAPARPTVLRNGGPTVREAIGSEEADMHSQIQERPFELQKVRAYRQSSGVVTSLWKFVEWRVAHVVLPAESSGQFGTFTLQ